MHRDESEKQKGKVSFPPIEMMSVFFLAVAAASLVHALRLETRGNGAEIASHVSASYDLIYRRRQ